MSLEFIMPTKEQAERQTRHLISRMGEEGALEAMVDATGLLLHTLVDMGSLARLSATAAGGYSMAASLADHANGRRLTDEKKRQRLAAIAEVSRDAADQIERAVL